MAAKIACNRFELSCVQMASGGSRRREQKSPKRPLHRVGIPWIEILLASAAATNVVRQIPRRGVQLPRMLAAVDKRPALGTRPVASPSPRKKYTRRKAPRFRASVYGTGWGIGDKDLRPY